MYIDTRKLFKEKKCKFKVNDKVRISHLSYIFQRDYQEKWTEKIFIITHRHREQGIHLYRLKDFADEPIDGYLYEAEMQKVTKDADTLLRVEKVLKSRTRKGQKEHFVK